MQLTFKYRLFPASAQRTAMQQSLDACRWVYNKTLEVRRDAWNDERQSLSLYDTNKMLTQWKQEHSWLNQAFSQALQEAQQRVELAFKHFFRRVKNGEEPGYPRFKGDWYKSFTYKQPWNGFSLDGDRLYLSKIGHVRIKMHRPMEGEVKTLTVKRDSLGNWHACFACEVEPKPLLPTDKVVGVDLGLTTFATLSNGGKIERQRWMRRDAKEIARLQRKKERFPKGSPEHRKAIRALQHAYQRATNRRSDFAHKQSHHLVDEYQFIAFENLDIKEMQQNAFKAINRGIADVAWNQFVQFTTYKAEKAGRGVALVDPRNTTQMCSGCGELVPKDLSVRTHSCSCCGLTLNRDINAALNILSRGLSAVGLDP